MGELLQTLSLTFIPINVINLNLLCRELIKATHFKLIQLIQLHFIDNLSYVFLFFYIFFLCLLLHIKIRYLYNIMKILVRDTNLKSFEKKKLLKIQILCLFFIIRHV